MLHLHVILYHKEATPLNAKVRVDNTLDTL